MTDSSQPKSVSAWRIEMLSLIRIGSVEEASDALLSLVYNDRDREWVETILLECLDTDIDQQIKALAITCFGHLARLHNAVDKDRVVPLLMKLVEDHSGFSGVAGDALEDIELYVNGVTDG